MVGASDRLVVLGRITGSFGLRGELKVQSYTQPREGIYGYRPWTLKQGGTVTERAVATGRRHGQGVVVALEGIADRDAAAAFIGAEILVRRDQLPAPAAGETYWTDLEGLRVEALDGTVLGKVDHLFTTGANDVLVVQGDRERLIPYLPEVVHAVDLDAGVLRVDWDPEF